MKIRQDFVTNSSSSSFILVQNFYFMDRVDPNFWKDDTNIERILRCYINSYFVENDEVHSVRFNKDMDQLEYWTEGWDSEQEVPTLATLRNAITIPALVVLFKQHCVPITTEEVKKNIQKSLDILTDTKDYSGEPCTVPNDMFMKKYEAEALAVDYALLHAMTQNAPDDTAITSLAVRIEVGDSHGDIENIPFYTILRNYWGINRNDIFMHSNH